MSNDESKIDERGRDMLNSDQEDEKVGEGRGASDEGQMSQETDKAAPKETLENNQSVRNDKKDRRVKRGRENWGGYQGY